jgi:hypothetical protein
MISKIQLIDYVIYPTLNSIHLWSQSAENLLLGTCAQESQMGTYLHQLGKGPACGIYQMEPVTYKHLINRLMQEHELIREIIFRECNFVEFPTHMELITNLKFATIMTRLYYKQFQEPLPASDDVPGLARYWKKYYNTAEGKGTEKEFIDNYKKYVL